MLFVLSFNFSVSAQLTGDPWIFNAYKELYGRQPNAWELNINNYNLGSWNNYSELKTYVQQYQNSMSKKGISIKTTNLANNEAAVILSENGYPAASALISNTSGSLIGNDGAGAFPKDAAKLIGIDAGTLKNLPVVSFGTVGTKYLASSGTKVIPASGRGTLVIKKK